MAEKRINTLGVNIRKEPSNRSDVINVMFAGQAVDTVGSVVNDRWQEVEIGQNGSTSRGFISARFLRDPLSPKKEALIENCITEWNRFDREKGKETDPQFAGFVADMWRALGVNEADVARRIRERWAWSAAFISFVMRKAGYDDFKFSGLHNDYIKHSVEQRIDRNQTTSFWAYQLPEHKPKVGDLVARWRGSTFTLGQILANDQSSPVRTHCDVVIAAPPPEIPGQPSNIFIAGGNLGDTVKVLRKTVGGNGFIDTRMNGHHSFFAVIGDPVSFDGPELPRPA